MPTAAPARRLRSGGWQCSEPRGGSRRGGPFSRKPFRDPLHNPLRPAILRTRAVHCGGEGNMQLRSTGEVPFCRKTTRDVRTPQNPKRALGRMDAGGLARESHLMALPWTHPAFFMVECKATICPFTTTKRNSRCLNRLTKSRHWRSLVDSPDGRLDCSDCSQFPNDGNLAVQSASLASSIPGVIHWGWASWGTPWPSTSSRPAFR